MGILAGGPLALATTQAVAIALRHAPVSIQPRDLLTFLVMATVLEIVGVAAMVGSAWRAAGADPHERVARRVIGSVFDVPV
jgi:hypothetical protein